MTPIEFPGSNVVYAKDQPQHLPLPAMKDEQGNITTCWLLSEEEIKAIVQSKRLYIHVTTFNQPLQPIRPYTKYKEPEPVSLPHIDASDFDMLSRCREAYNDVRLWLDEDDKDHLISMCQTLINKEGAEKAWPYFKFEGKFNDANIETLKKAFRYMEFISMEHMAKGMEGGTNGVGH